MQHHGCATRLLDFTSNPLIALFFASDPAIKGNGEVVIAKYRLSHENVSDKGLFERTKSFVYYPPHLIDRIIGQSGCFVYARTPNNSLSGKQIEKIKIKEHLKFKIRKELKELGISHSTLFPGMDGICEDLNDSLISNLQSEDLDFILS